MACDFLTVETAFLQRIYVLFFISLATRRAWPKLESFALIAAEEAMKRRISPSELGGGAADIDYAGPAGTIRTFSFSDVLNGRFPRHTFRGKVVLVGASPPSLKDVHPTPIADAMSGVEIQANAVHTALRGFPLRARTGIDLALIALLGLIVPLASLRFGWIVLVGVAAAVGGLYVLTLQLAFDHHVLLPAVYPLLALVLATALALRARWALTRRTGPFRA
jgi:CHASE2 domain-containing sensor protein